MAKIVVYEGLDIRNDIIGRKAALIDYDTGFSDMEGVLVKSFAKGEASQAFSQMKRWISSASFDILVFSGFSEAFSDFGDDDVLFWIKDHVDAFERTSLVVLDDHLPGMISKVAEKRADLDF